MSLIKEHELHKRRKSRNIGLGLVLASFVFIVFGLTYVKITRGGFEPNPSPASMGVGNGN